MVVIGGHTVGGGNGSERAGVIVSAPIAHHPDGTYRQQHREGLPDRIIEPGIANLFQIDGIRLAQDVQFLGCDRLAGNADSQTRTREGMAADKGVGQANSRPRSRTSSLNNSRSGSTSRIFIRSGRPPTLWWLLIVTEGPPVKETLSITSGYSVPWAKKSAPPIFLASDSNTSIKSPPMVLRFFSDRFHPQWRRGIFGTHPHVSAEY